MNTRIKGCVPSFLATIVILNFLIILLAAESWRQLQSSWITNVVYAMSSQKAGNKKFPKPRCFFYKWTVNIIHPITMECQEHSYKAEGKYTPTTLPLKGSFLNAYKRKCAVVRELTTHLDMAAHTYNPWHLRGKARELLVGATGWKTLTPNEQNVNRKKIIIQLSLLKRWQTPVCISPHHTNHKQGDKDTLESLIYSI